MSLADLRKEYTLSGLRRTDLIEDPIRQFQYWLEPALKGQPGEPYAMTLATADRSGRPSARTVLLRGVDERGFIFYTSHESRKGREMAENPCAALVFHWPVFERQVCVTGDVMRLSIEESQAYFRSRPVGNQLAAWASQQSHAVSRRSVFQDEMVRLTREYQNREIPMPPHWGGYVLAPLEIEFWQGRPSRLHDRFRYQKQTDGSWLIERLSP